MSANSNTKGSESKPVSATFRVYGLVTGGDEVTVNSAERTLTCESSTMFGPLNQRRAYEHVAGCPVKGFTMTTAKGDFFFTNFRQPERYDGQAFTYTCELASPDNTVATWTFTVFND